MGGILSICAHLRLIGNRSRIRRNSCSTPSSDFSSSSPRSSSARGNSGSRPRPARTSRRPPWRWRLALTIVAYRKPGTGRTRDRVALAGDPPRHPRHHPGLPVPAAAGRARRRCRSRTSSACCWTTRAACRLPIVDGQPRRAFVKSEFGAADRGAAQGAVGALHRAHVPLLERGRRARRRRAT